MQITKWAILLIFLPFFSACSTPVQKDFLKNFKKDTQQSDGSFASLIVDLKYNEKSNVLVASHDSGTIDIWSTNEARSKREIKAHEYRPNSIALNSEGNIIFSSSTFGRSTKLWSAESGKQLYFIRDMTGPVSTTPNNQVYVVANKEYFRLFNYGQKHLLSKKYENGAVITTITTDMASGLIAVGTEYGTIEMWKYLETNGKPSLVKVASARPYQVGNWVVGLQFSADGKGLFSVSRYGSIDEWTPGNMKKMGSVKTTLKYVNSTSFFRDRNLLALAGTIERIGTGPGSIELISLATGETKTYPANTNLAVVEFLPPIASLISAQKRTVGVHALPKQ